MSAAYFIVLGRGAEAVDTAMSGKSLSRHIDSLDETAHQLGVRPLSEFFSADPQQVASFMRGEGIAAIDTELLPPQQFSAGEGLATVRALLSNPQPLAPGVEEDLRACERILIAAEEHGIGWHFEIDF